MSNNQHKKKITYVLLIMTTLLLPVAYCFGIAFVAIFGVQNGHGIDGIGAALASVFIFKLIMIISCIAFVVFAIIVTKRIRQDKSIPNFLAYVPFLPVLIFGCFVACNNTYRTYQLNVKRNAYTIETYIVEVKEKKDDYRHRIADGVTAIDAYSYILYNIAEDNYWLYTELQFNKDKRKAIVDEAIPILMNDLMMEDICDYIYHNETGEMVEQYFMTTIDYWNYKSDENKLIVKFSHKSEPYEFNIEYIFD